jgi:Na+-transporting methylmalonyl-CoA/oxaloacetate decarboxylase gamma subunit
MERNAISRSDLGTPMQPFDFQNVIDADGISIAVMGMLIVFVALALVSLFIASLPRILEALNDYLPAEHAHHGGHAAAAADDVDDDEPIIAALGFVLHQELHKQQTRSG